MSVLHDPAKLKISIENYANQMVQPTAKRAHIYYAYQLSMQRGKFCA